MIMIIRLRSNRNLITTRSLITIRIRKVDLTSLKVEALLIRMIKMQETLTIKQKLSLMHKIKTLASPKMQYKN